MRPGPSPWVFPSSTAICRGAASPVAPCMRWCPKLKAQRRPPSASSRRCLFAYRPLPSLPLPLVGRGQGWGSGGQAQVSTPFMQPRDPPPYPPHKGEGKGKRPLFFVMPRYGLGPHGRLHGHGLGTLGLDPARLILVETAHRRDTLWAMEEALRSRAPAGRRRNDRQARSEIEPKAAARRGGCGAAAPAAAAGVDAGIERGGNALAHRHGQGRARPFRSDRAGALASHA